MRWLNCDPQFLPHLAEMLEVSLTADAVCIAEFEGTSPISGVILDAYNGKSIHAHIWIAPGRKPSRLWYVAVFHYLFEQLKVENIIGTVPSSNKRARKLDEHFGFKLHTSIPNYYENGDDMLLYICTVDSVFDWRALLPHNVAVEA